MSNKANVSTKQRANVVLKEIKVVTSRIASDYLTLGRLLAEAFDGGYYLMWGHTSFEAWFDGQNFDFEFRKAQYLMAITRKSAVLKLEDEDLQQCGLSRLREIFTLSPETHAKDIRRLVKSSPEQHMEDVKGAVADMLGNRPQAQWNVSLPSLKAAKSVRTTLKDISKRWDCSVGAAFVRIITGLHEKPALLAKL